MPFNHTQLRGFFFGIELIRSFRDLLLGALLCFLVQTVADIEYRIIFTSNCGARGGENIFLAFIPLETSSSTEFSSQGLLKFSIYGRETWCEVS